MSRTPPVSRPNNPLDLIRSEPRKTAVLAMLLAVMGGLWAKVFLSSSPAGGAARATDSGLVEVTAATPAPVPGVLSASSIRLSQWLRQPLPPVGRNLFTIDYDKFPPDASSPSQTTQSGFWEQLAKSMDFRADQDIARRTLVENLQKRASKLRLKATLNVNGGRTALIDDSLVSEGDVVDGFRILRIETNRLVVECDGIRFAILSETR